MVGQRLRILAHVALNVLRDQRRRERDVGVRGANAIRRLEDAVGESDVE